MQEKIRRDRHYRWFVYALVALLCFVFGILPQFAGAQTTWGYPNEGACVNDASNYTPSGYSAQYSNEFRLFADNEYEHYRLSSNPGTCYKVPPNLKRAVTMSNVANFTVGTPLHAITVRAVGSTVAYMSGRFYDAYKAAVAWGGWEAYANMVGKGLPSTVKAHVSISETITYSALNDPCGSLVVIPSVGTYTGAIMADCRRSLEKRASFKF